MFSAKCGHAPKTDIEAAFRRAAVAQPNWDKYGGDARANLLERFADNLEALRPELVAILCREAGKTIPDAVDEVREAVEFLPLLRRPGPGKIRAGRFPSRSHRGKQRVKTRRARRIRMHQSVEFSPGDFLWPDLRRPRRGKCGGRQARRGNAHSSPAKTVRLLHAAGVPDAVCNLLIGDGAIGERMVRHPLSAGVAFTGSTETARRINRALADKEGPIAPLIAETGGQNAMIVDSTALLEQVTDDVIRSAFLSAGQRCSALRALYLQEEIADQALTLVRGAMDELRVGDPTRIETDLGPIISESAAGDLQAHISRLRKRGRLLHQAALSPGMRKRLFRRAQSRAYQQHR